MLARIPTPTPTTALALTLTLTLQLGREGIVARQSSTWGDRYRGVASSLPLLGQVEVRVMVVVACEG